ncbi:MAG: hypothetical protein AAGI30_07155 [Planctomycetota bacterium]
MKRLTYSRRAGRFSKASSFVYSFNRMALPTLYSTALASPAIVHLLDRVEQRTCIPATDAPVLDSTPACAGC